MLRLGIGAGPAVSAVGVRPAMGVGAPSASAVGRALSSLRVAGAPIHHQRAFTALAARASMISAASADDPWPPRGSSFRGAGAVARAAAGNVTYVTSSMVPFFLVCECDCS